MWSYVHYFQFSCTKIGMKTLPVFWQVIIKKKGRSSNSTEKSDCHLQQNFFGPKRLNSCLLHHRKQHKLYLNAPEWILIRSQPSQTSTCKDCINPELNEHTWEISGSQHCCQNGPLCTHTHFLKLASHLCKTLNASITKRKIHE